MQEIVEEKYLFFYLYIVCMLEIILNLFRKKSWTKIPYQRIYPIQNTFLFKGSISPNDQAESIVIYR